MNGFLLSSGNFENEKAPKKLLVYKEVIESLEKFSLQKFISFFVWGKYPGDIHYHMNKDSFLVLNGYISDAKTLESFTTQKEAAKCLQDLLDLDHSISRCMEIAGEIHGSFSIIYINIPERITFCMSCIVTIQYCYRQNTYIVCRVPTLRVLYCTNRNRRERYIVRKVSMRWIVNRERRFPA